MKAIFLCLNLVLFISMSAHAENISSGAALDNACPLPHNDCSPSCGTSCVFWTCNDARNRTIDFDTLPVEYYRATDQCVSRLNAVVHRTTPFTPFGASTVDSMPTSFSPKSFICKRNVKSGTCCSWSVGSWSSCSKSCGGGIRQRSVTCNAANGWCCGPRPSNTLSCNTQACIERPRCYYTTYGCCSDGRTVKQAHGCGNGGA